MRPNSLLILLVAIFAASNWNVIGAAEETTPNNIDVPPPSDTKAADSTSNARHLRRSQDVNNEERVVFAFNPNVVFPRRKASKPSAQSSQIVHAVENNKPLPKWAKVFLVLAGLGVATGVVGGGVKLLGVGSTTTLESA